MDPVEPAEQTPGPVADPHGIQREPIMTAPPDVDVDGRWQVIKSQFLDSPREAAAAADELVAEVIGSITRRLDQQRAELGDLWRHDDTDTESLRTVMLRYREVLDRLEARIS